MVPRVVSSNPKDSTTENTCKYHLTPFTTLCYILLMDKKPSFKSVKLSKEAYDLLASRSDKTGVSIQFLLHIAVMKRYAPKVQS